MSASIAGLYAITDARLPRRVGLEQAVAAALRGGARIIQYRDKSTDSARRLAEATALSVLCASAKALFIVNDDVPLAKAVGADGVHVGQSDAQVTQAREQLGDAAIIGVSCYGDLERAQAAANAGADYLAFGSVYPSPTKPQAATVPLSIFAQARAFTDLPLVAIGGINADNIATVRAAGADAIAVVDAVFGADDIEQACVTLGKTL